MILVTGGSGYLGQHVVAVLEARGVAFRALRRRQGIGLDLSQLNDVTRLFERQPPWDAIIHCAAVVPKDAGAYSDRDAAWQSIVMMHHLASRLNRPPIVFASSMTATEATSAYSWGKRMAEDVLQRWAIPGDVIVRLPGLFGFPRRAGLVFNMLTAALVGQVLDATPCEGWTAVSVQDAAAALVDAVSQPEPRLVEVRYTPELFRQRLREFLDEIRAEVNA